jgi:glucose/arabinose dehydrogenase
MSDTKQKPKAKPSGAGGKKPDRFKALRWNLYSLLGGIGAVLIVIALGWMPMPLIPGLTSMQAVFEKEPEIIERLELPDGYKANLFAVGVGRARGMAMTPNGDILVAAPGRKLMLVKADRSGDGRSDGVEMLADDLRSPHGLYLDGDWLYVAETDGVVRMRYDADKGELVGEREKVASGIPGGGAHWTRTINKGPDGWFYVTVGSSCNVCIGGHPWRAAMVRFKPGEQPELYATGLRNTVGFDWHPVTGELYGVDNGRDWLGDDFPPEEVNLIVEGGFYGWPFLNGDNVADPDYGDRAGPKAAEARKPVHNMEAHSAPLGMRFLRNSQVPDMKNAALVARHGSWNRDERIGYDVVSLHWDGDGKISQRPFLSGFNKDGEVSGRPVDVVEAGDGTLYVSDDLSGVIWRIQYAPES